MLEIAIILCAVIAVIIGAYIMEYMSNHPKSIFAEENEQDAFVLGRQEETSITLRKKAVAEDEEDDEEVKFELPSKQAGAMFGHAIAQEHKKYIAISAPGYGRTKTTNASGCVFVFEKMTGKLHATITPPKPMAGQMFGSDVTFIDNKTLSITDKDDKSFSVTF